MMSFLRNYIYSSGVKIVQIWHRDRKPGIVESSNWMISRDWHDSNDLYAHEIPSLFYHIKDRGSPLDGGYVLLLHPSSMRRLVRNIEHCHVETRMDDFCRQI